MTRGEAAVVAHVVGAVALVEQAEEDEERGTDERFVEDLEGAAVDAEHGEAEDAERDEADVREGGEGGELLEVVLDEGEQRAVDDADGSEGDEQRGDVAGLVREEAEAEAQDGVEAELAGERP